MAFEKTLAVLLAEAVARCKDGHIGPMEPLGSFVWGRRAVTVSKCQVCGALADSVDGPPVVEAGFAEGLREEALRPLPTVGDLLDRLQSYAHRHPKGRGAPVRAVFTYDGSYGKEEAQSVSSAYFDAEAVWLRWDEGEARR